MKPSQLIATLPKLLEGDQAIMVWGDPGIGKSEIVRSTALNCGLLLIDLRLNIYDPTELKGFPTKVTIGKKEFMRFVPSGRLPTDPKSRGILFLDELPSSTPAVQAASYQLILDRRLDEYELPEGWKIIAAGNYARNGGVHYSMPPALRNRFQHIGLDYNQPDWDEWASVNGISPVTRAFLRFRPALLHDMGLAKAGHAFPTPRSWARADAVFQCGYPAGIALELLEGQVGEGPAREYLAFAQMAAELPTAHEIAMAPGTAPVPSRPDAKHAVTTMLESTASTKNMKAYMAYIKRLDLEFQAAFTTGIARMKRELTSMPEYIDWCVKHNSLLLA